MTAKGHTLLGLNATALLFQYEPIREAFFHLDYSGIPALAIIVFAVLLGTLFPDMDEHGSYISRRLPLLTIFGFVVKHRTITHFFITGAAIITYSFYFVHESLYRLFFIFFGAGWILHTVGDLLTKGGIKGYFWPLYPNTTIGLLPKPFRFTTNGATEHVINFLLFLVLVWQGSKLF